MPGREGEPLARAVSSCWSTERIGTSRFGSLQGRQVLDPGGIGGRRNRGEGLLGEPGGGNVEASKQALDGSMWSDGDGSGGMRVRSSGSSNTGSGAVACRSRWSPHRLCKRTRGGEMRGSGHINNHRGGGEKKQSGSDDKIGRRIFVRCAHFVAAGQRRRIFEVRCGTCRQVLAGARRHQQTQQPGKVLTAKRLSRRQ